MATSYFFCPKCNKCLESLVPYGAKGVAEPFRICPRCNSYVLFADLFNEWELLTDKQKDDMRMRAIFTAVMLGGVPGGFGSFIGLGTLFPDFLEQSSTTILLTCLVFFVIGSRVSYFFVKKGLDDAIEKSKLRMSDITYRITLQKLGLLK